MERKMFISKDGFIRPRITAERVVESKPPEVPPAIEPVLSRSPSLQPTPTPLGVLGLSARPHFALIQAGITTISQLAAMSREQIREVRNVSEKGLTEIEEKLAAYLAEHPLPDEVEEGPPEPEAQAAEPLPPQPPSPPPDPTPLGVLGLSFRIHNALLRAGITTIGQLAMMSHARLFLYASLSGEITTVGQLAMISDEQIREVRNVGEKALAEIEEKLATYLAEHPLPDVPQQQGCEMPEIMSENVHPHVSKKTSIAVLKLSADICARLKLVGVTTIEDLAWMSPEHILDVPYVDEKSLLEIESALTDYLAEHFPSGPPFEPEEPSFANAPLGTLGLSVRSHNALMRAGIRTVGKLVGMSDEDLLSVHNIGIKSLADIREKLAAYLAEHPLPDEAEEGPSEPEAQAAEPLPSQPLSPPPDPTPLGVLGLSARPYNALKRAGINTIGQLATMSCEQIREVRNIGEKALAEIESRLGAYLTDPSRFKAAAVVAEPSSLLPAPPPPDSEIPSTPMDEQTLAVQVGKWLSELTDRQRQVIRRRYGLNGNEPETLEEVGQWLGTTRERVRQIQFKALERLRSPRRRQQVHPWATLLYQTLIKAGGLCTEERLGQVIAEATDTIGIDVQGVARLILEIHSVFKEVRGVKERIWGLSDAPLKLVPDIHQQMAKILKNEQVPLPFGEILARFKATCFYQDHRSQLDDTFVEACLRVHPNIETNNEGLCALTKWSSRRLHEIIQALRELGEPSHYSKIAETINVGLSPERHITPQAVHVRLMHHPELFVWVGCRGTYGLKGWGLERSLSYEEAIARILQRAGHPLTFQQILAQLPALRSYYDESSIVLTLGTNERFHSFPDGTYGLAEWREDEVVTEDYRLQRLLDGVEATPLSTRLKPVVAEALNGVDSFIAQAREKASDGQ